MRTRSARRRLGWGRWLMAVALLCVAPCFAQGLALGQQEPAMEPLAATVHGRFCQALRDLSSFTVHADVLVDAVHEDGSVVQRARRVDLAARRPAAFRAITEGDDLALESYFDGKALTLRFPRENTTATLPAAMDLDSLLDVLARDHGLEAPLGDLLRQDACAGMRPLAAYHVGMSRVEGVACHHLYLNPALPRLQVA